MDNFAMVCYEILNRSLACWRTSVPSTKLPALFLFMQKARYGCLNMYRLYVYTANEHLQHLSAPDYQEWLLLFCGIPNRKYDINPTKIVSQASSVHQLLIDLDVAVRRSRSWDSAMDLCHPGNALLLKHYFCHMTEPDPKNKQVILCIFFNLRLFMKI